MSISELLRKWKSESLFGERHFKKQNFSLIDGEELYLLSFNCKVSVDGQSTIIYKHKFFQTRIQNMNNSDDINPNADIYICEKILTQLENDFIKDYNNFIDSEVQKKTCP